MNILKSLNQVSTKGLYWLLIICFLVIAAFPILWMVTAAFRPNIELSSDPFGIPSTLTLENFKTVFTDSNVLTYIKTAASFLSYP